MITRLERFINLRWLYTYAAENRATLLTGTSRNRAYASLARHVDTSRIETRVEPYPEWKQAGDVVKERTPKGDYINSGLW